MYDDDDDDASKDQRKLPTIRYFPAGKKIAISGEGDSAAEALTCRVPAAVGFCRRRSNCWHCVMVV